MHPKDADGLANSVDPDQTASALFDEISVPIHRICTVLKIYKGVLYDFSIDDSTMDSYF